MHNNIEVLVVGAGPVGLLAAIELKLTGIEVLIVERLSEMSPLPKAGGIGPLGLEALRRRGLSDAIEAAEARFSKTRAQRDGDGPRYSGHFAGLTLIRANAQSEPDRCGSQVNQQAIEAMLSDRAKALGIEIRRSWEVIGVSQQPNGVDVDLMSPAGLTQLHCTYLIGCDGGRSSVRKMAGFSFPGWEPSMTMHQAIVKIDHPELLIPGGFQYTSNGMYMVFGDRLALIEFGEVPANRDAPISRDYMEDKLRQMSGADVHITDFSHATRWTDNTRLVDSYRRGRIFLAGDAAHIHSPFGGQGLSLGLLDATNLGWKLGAVLRNNMPTSLLDTYEMERRPIAEAVIANTLAQVAIMRPDPQSSAMRDLVTQLMSVDGANRFFGNEMNGLYRRYDLGVSTEIVGQLIANMPVGTDMLYDLMQDGKGVLLDATGGEALAMVNTSRIAYATVESGPSMLIRPDACVAWTSDNGIEGLKAAFGLWWGANPINS
jgi:2-polyprenyl-6-methoxyphenol hydroxylase-like FAD-dependent oxidoreductase